MSVNYIDKSTGDLIRVAGGTLCRINFVYNKTEVK